MNPWLVNQDKQHLDQSQQGKGHPSKHTDNHDNKEEKMVKHTNTSSEKSDKNTFSTPNPPNAWSIPTIPEHFDNDVKMKRKDNKKDGYTKYTDQEASSERKLNDHKQQHANDIPKKNNINDHQKSHHSKRTHTINTTNKASMKLNKHKSMLPTTKFVINKIKPKSKAVMLTLGHQDFQFDMLIPASLNQDPVLTEGMQVELINFSLNKSQVMAINENRAPSIGGQSYGNIRTFKIHSPMQKVKSTSYEEHSKLTSANQNSSSSRSMSHTDQHAWKKNKSSRPPSNYSPQKNNRNNSNNNKSKHYLTSSDHKPKRSRSAGPYHNNSRSSKSSYRRFYSVPYQPYFQEKMPPRLSLGRLRRLSKHFQYPPPPYTPVQEGNCYQIISCENSNIRIPLHEDKQLVLLSDGDSYMEAALPLTKEKVLPLTIVNIKHFEVRYVQGLSIMFVDKFEIEKKAVTVIGHPWAINMDSTIRSIQPICNCTSKSRDDKFRDIKPRKADVEFDAFTNRAFFDFEGLKPNFASEFWALHSYHQPTTALSVYYFEAQSNCFIYSPHFENVKEVFANAEQTKKKEAVPRQMTIDDVPMVQLHSLEYISEVLSQAEMYFNVFYIKSFVLNPHSMTPIDRNPISIRHRVPLRNVFERLNRTKVLRRLLSQLFYPLDFSKGKKTVLIAMLMHYLFEEGKVLFFKHVLNISSLRQVVSLFESHDFLHMNEEDVSMFFTNVVPNELIQAMAKAFMIPNANVCDLQADLCDEILKLSYSTILNTMDLDLLLEICNQMFINFKSWVSNHSQDRDSIIQYILTESFPWMLHPCDRAYDGLAGTIAYMLKHCRSRIMGTFGVTDQPIDLPPASVTISAIKGTEIKLEEVHASPPSSVPMGELVPNKSPLTSSVSHSLSRERKVEDTGRSRSRSNASPLLLTNDLIINDSSYIAIPHHDDLKIGLVYHWKPEKRVILYSPDGSQTEQFEITSASILSASSPAVHSVELGDLVEFSVVDDQCQIISILQRRDAVNGDIELYHSQYLKYQTSTLLQDGAFNALISRMKACDESLRLPKLISSYPPQFSHRVFKGQIVRYGHLHGLLKVQPPIDDLGVEIIPFFSDTSHLRVGDHVRFQIYHKNLIQFAHRLHRVARSVTFKVPTPESKRHHYLYDDDLMAYSKSDDDGDETSSSSDSDDEDTDIKNASDVEDSDFLPRSSVDITQIEDMLQANRSRSGSIVQSPLMFSQIKDLAIGIQDDDSADETEGELDDDEAQAQIEEMFGMLALDEEEDRGGSSPLFSPDYKPYASIENDMLQDQFDTHEDKEIILITNPSLPLLSPITPTSFVPTSSFLPFSSAIKPTTHQ